MFGFIKNLVKKSDNNFFLELKEEVEAKIDEVKNEITETKDTKDTKETKKVEAKQPASNGAKPVASTPAKPAATPDSNGKMSRKDTAAAAKAAKEAEAASSDPAQLIAKATAKKQQPIAAPVETNFATKYLMTPSSNGRRRPGANMNSYLEMARQVKTPTSNK